MLELYEVVKALLVVACPSVFLFYDGGRHAKLLTLIKEDPFYVFLLVVVRLHRIFGRSKGRSYCICQKLREFLSESCVEYFLAFF